MRSDFRRAKSASNRRPFNGGVRRHSVRLELRLDSRLVDDGPYLHDLFVAELIEDVLGKRTPFFRKHSGQEIAPLAYS